jgi:hypothetical protein
MDTVHHYSSLNGFLGIIGGCGLWSTNVAYLNDAAKITHALDFARGVTGSIYMQDDYLAAFGWVTRHALSDLDIRDLYVTSFSEAPDLLSQWADTAHMELAFVWDSTSNFTEIIPDERGIGLKNSYMETKMALTTSKNS